MLTPFVVARWNGINVWVQWTPGGEGYALQMRFQKPGQPWTEWRDMLRPWPLTRSYFSLPIHNQGSLVEARVAPATEGWVSPEWEPAQAAVFARCRASFRIETERKVTFPTGRVFAAQVDEFVASYKLGAMLDLEPGDAAEFEMEAAQITGGCQLDRPEHFDLNPMPGVRLWNLTASENDLTPLGGTAVKIEPAALGGPVVIAFQQRI